MRIVILGNQARAMLNFWPVLLRQLRQAGHTVFCLVPTGDAEGDAGLRATGARVYHYPLDRKGINPVRDIRTFWHLWHFLRKKKPDALFCFTIKPVIYGLLAAKFAGIRPHTRCYAMITGLGYAFEADSLAKKILNHFAALLYRTALHGIDAIFFQNQDDRQTFLKQGIVRDSDPIRLCRGTGVDTERFAPRPLPQNSCTFLLVGRLLEAKGIREFAEAASILRPRWPDAHFQILGPPEQGAGSVSVSQLQKWQAQDSIEYLGETRDVRPYLEAAHVMVLPSWREGTPCSILEGMSMGRPAVVTDAPGCREVVRHGENGFLVPLRNPQALALAMERFLEDPGLVSSLGNAGRALAEEVFDAEKIAAELVAIFEGKTVA